MHAKNGRPIRIESGLPGYPRGMNHLLIHAACDRFLASRGITAADPTSRRHGWLFGHKRRAAK